MTNELEHMRKELSQVKTERDQLRQDNQNVKAELVRSHSQYEMVVAEEKKSSKVLLDKLNFDMGAQTRTRTLAGLVRWLTHAPHRSAIFRRQITRYH